MNWKLFKLNGNFMNFEFILFSVDPLTGEVIGQRELNLSKKHGPQSAASPITGGVKYKN